MQTFFTAPLNHDKAHDAKGDGMGGGKSENYSQCSIKLSVFDYSTNIYRTIEIHFKMKSFRA